MATSGLNPKGFLLYLALLPKFVDSSAGWPVAAQTALLGVVHMVDCAVVYLAVGVLAGTVLRARPALARGVGRIAGVVMIGIGVALLVEQPSRVTADRCCSQCITWHSWDCRHGASELRCERVLRIERLVA